VECLLGLVIETNTRLTGKERGNHRQKAENKRAAMHKMLADTLVQ
jgi:hypothetical protein